MKDDDSGSGGGHHGGGVGDDGGKSVAQMTNHTRLLLQILMEAGYWSHIQVEVGS